MTDFPHLFISKANGATTVPAPDGSEGFWKVGRIRTTQSWGAFCSKLAHKTPNKKGSWAIIWGDFRPDDMAIPKNYKGKGKFSFQRSKWFKGRNVIALDVDNCNVEFSVLVERLQELGVDFCAYTSYSYDLIADKLKFRVFLPLDKKLAGKEYKLAVLGVLNELGLDGDYKGKPIVDVSASTTPNQLMYLPECPKDMADEAHIEYKADAGPLSVDGYIEAGKFLSGKDGTADTESGWSIPPPEEVQEGDRHDYLKRWVAKLYHGGIRKWEVIYMVLQGINSRLPHPLDEKDKTNGLPGLRRVFDTVVNGEVEEEEESELIGRFYFLPGEGKFYDVELDKLISEPSLNNMFYHSNPGGKDGPPKASSIILAKSDSIVSDRWWEPVPYGVEIDRIITNPKGLRVVNTYQHPALKPMDMDSDTYCYMIDRFLALFDALIPQPDERKIILQSQAHMLLHPEQKPNWNVVLYGSPGSGKDTIYSPLMRILGPGKGKDVSPDSFSGNFNGELEGLLLANIQEPEDITEKKRFMTGLKRMTGGNSTGLIEIHAKNENKRYVYDAIRVVIQVNTLEALEVAQGDRRNLIVEANPKEEVIAKLNKKFGYTGFGFFADWKEKWIKGDMQRAVMTYLLHEVGLSDFNYGHLPKETELHKELVVDGLPEWKKLLMDDILADGTYNGRLVFGIRELVEELKTNCFSGAPLESELISFLKSKLMGFAPLDKRGGRKINRKLIKTPYLWCHRKNLVEVEKLAVGALYDLYHLRDDEWEVFD